MASKEMRFKDFKIKSVNDDEGVVEGYASRYNIVDSANDIVMPGAFKQGLAQSANRVRFLWKHDHNQVIGSIIELRDDPKGLYFKAKFAPTQKAQDTRQLMMMDPPGLDSFSIGYRVIREEVGVKNGRSVNLLKEIKVHEISVVPFACNEDARMTAVKSEMEDRFGGLDLQQQVLVSKFIDFLCHETKSDDPLSDTPEDMDHSEQPVSQSEPTDTVVEADTPISEGSDALDEINAALELDMLARALRRAL